MVHELAQYMQRPPVYAPGTAALWDDEHISKGMLAAHLNPTLDSATRPIDFVGRSVKWISAVAPARAYPRLLDLGCGPGIYAELFDGAGYRVTGVDLSARSIDHARTSARARGVRIDYRASNYLALSDEKAFDLVTLIYCDFGVLSGADRKALLQKIRAALVPGGRLIFDAFTLRQYDGQDEYRRYEYAASGFWRAGAYLCLSALYRYDAERTFLEQHVVIDEKGIECYNVWNHAFTVDELTRDLKEAGFAVAGVYGDVAGRAQADADKQLCIVAERV